MKGKLVRLDLKGKRWAVEYFELSNSANRCGCSVNVKSDTTSAIDDVRRVIPLYPEDQEILINENDFFIDLNGAEVDFHLFKSGYDTYAKIERKINKND